jgi:hypothetical protein
MDALELVASPAEELWLEAAEDAPCTVRTTSEPKSGEMIFVSFPAMRPMT